mmetsp:Transcript_5086/g.6490  ORF Transcript_5086/g.6490 Transcript_5086/m.6490 type:complete len:127 (+) Transcript_5086:363-743(+)
MDNDRDLQKQIKKIFGSEVLKEDGKTIDREKLGKVIFADSDKRRKLNKLTHTKIFKSIIWQIFDLRVLKRKQLVVLDAPLLFETKVLEYLCYPIIVVWIESLEEQMARLMKRNSLTAIEAKNKIDA